MKRFNELNWIALHLFAWGDMDGYARYLALAREEYAKVTA